MFQILFEVKLKDKEIWGRGEEETWNFKAKNIRKILTDFFLQKTYISASEK